MRKPANSQGDIAVACGSQARRLNEFYNTEEDMLVGKADLNALLQMLRVRRSLCKFQSVCRTSAIQNTSGTVNGTPCTERSLLQITEIRSHGKKYWNISHDIGFNPLPSRRMQAGSGTATDRLRLTLVYLLTCETLPSDADLAPIETALSAARDLQRVIKYRLHAASICSYQAHLPWLLSDPPSSHRAGCTISSGLQWNSAMCAGMPSCWRSYKRFASSGEAGADMAALAYVRRMRRMNLTGKATAGQPAPASLGDGLGAAWGLNWADKTFGQGLSSLTKGAFRAAQSYRTVISRRAQRRRNGEANLTRLPRLISPC